VLSQTQQLGEAFGRVEVVIDNEHSKLRDMIDEAECRTLLSRHPKARARSTTTAPMNGRL